MRFLWGLGLVELVTLTSLPARAEEGLPQLDTSFYAGQIFWLALSFGVLYLLMSKVALPRVAATQTNRKQVIAAEIEAARMANDAAKAAVIAVDKSLSEARGKAQASVSEMITEVTSEAAKRQMTQENELLRRLHRTEADIAVTREAALNAIGASAADLAHSVIEKILTNGRAAS